MGCDEEEVIADLTKKGFKVFPENHIDTLWSAYKANDLAKIEAWIKSTLGIYKEEPDILNTEVRSNE